MERSLGQQIQGRGHCREGENQCRLRRCRKKERTTKKTIHEGGSDKWSFMEVKEMFFAAALASLGLIALVSYKSVK
eukprot:764588-Hanusia_phi.AAC.2